MITATFLFSLSTQVEGVDVGKLPPKTTSPFLFLEFREQFALGSANLHFIKTWFSLYGGLEKLEAIPRLPTGSANTGSAPSHPPLNVRF